ncbi:MAG: putative glutamine amidotransferase [Mycobacteriales bacterium]
MTLGPQKVVDWVATAGCTPVLLPPLPDIEQAIARLDGLVLPGGPDVDPALYSAEVHPKTGRIDRKRDAAELALLDAALDADLPVLGICRGLQLLNVLRNGTLHQHLPEITGHNGHSPGLGRPGVYGSQDVRLAAGSRIAEALGGGTATVPCHHNQAIDRLGTGLTATAWAADGTVETVEIPGHPFAVAVQWHAEESDEGGLFTGLAEAARRAPANSR